MRYGHFDDERREYVITRPDTPLPWINYLGLEDYFGLVSNTGGGYSFYRDARLRRLTRYRYNNVPLDSGGRYLYLRDDDTGECWSPTWQPCRTALDGYACRHGLSYTRITSERGGIAHDLVYFVPPGEDLEIWHLRLSNGRDRPAALSLFSFVEFCLFDAQDDATNLQRNLSTGEVEVVDGVVYHKTEYRERRSHFAYFACSEPLAGFDTDRDAFLGPYRGLDRPLAVEAGHCSGSIASGWAPIGSHHVRLLLEAGEAREVVFVLGYFENPPDSKFSPPESQHLDTSRVRPVIDRWLEPEAAAKGLSALGERWSSLLSALEVRTPDTETDRMVNVWTPYQCMVTFNLSRSASYFESGVGRGMGFRDSNQDLLGFVQMVPERARQRILDLAATQLEDGGAYHQYQPLTKRGNDEIGSGFNDDPLWLVVSTAAYLKETGDRSILDEQVPFDGLSSSKASLYEHLLRSLRFSRERLGPHGLPLIGRADWNDCLNLNCFSETPGESFQTAENRPGGVAESVFLAGLFVLAARELSGIAEAIGQGEDLREWTAAAGAMEVAIAEAGWDGAWFLRAYDHFGGRVGSAECEEGQIYIEPQGMCVMAGVGVADGRALVALDSVAARLAGEHGIALVDPPYGAYHVELGEISSYPPGYKENGSVFCHTNPWVMIAEATLGRGDRAFDYYKRISPAAREALSEVHRCEPFVYAQTIAAPPAPRAGEAKNSWLTGAAAWNYVAITQWILGIRPELEGLRIDPVLPTAWPGFSATRRFRGATYLIEVEKPAGVAARVRRLVVDGSPVEGTLVPVAAPGRSVSVVAIAE